MKPYLLKSESTIGSEILTTFEEEMKTEIPMPTWPVTHL
jgi:hypothetical protein